MGCISVPVSKEGDQVDILWLSIGIEEIRILIIYHFARPQFSGDGLPTLEQDQQAEGQRAKVPDGH